MDADCVLDFDRKAIVANEAAGEVVDRADTVAPEGQIVRHCAHSIFAAKGYKLIFEQ